MLDKTIHRKEYRQFLKRLRQARLDAKLSQAAVARKLKRQQTYVSKAELGEKRLDVLEVREFARLYRKPFRFFFPEL